MEGEGQSKLLGTAKRRNGGGKRGSEDLGSRRLESTGGVADGRRSTLVKRGFQRALIEAACCQKNRNSRKRRKTRRDRGGGTPPPHNTARNSLRRLNCITEGKRRPPRKVSAFGGVRRKIQMEIRSKVERKP